MDKQHNFDEDFYLMTAFKNCIILNEINNKIKKSIS